MMRSRVYGGILYVSHTDPHQERYALVQGRYTGKWSFPKGHSTDGETPMECTVREIAEETGIKHLPPPIEYLRIGYGNYYVFPVLYPVPLLPIDTHEIINTAWVTMKEMDTLMLNVDVSRYRRGWFRRHVESTS